MNTQEIMVIRNEGGKDRLKIFAVDNLTLSRLTCVRGNLYRDDSKLQVVKDMPTAQPLEPPIDPEMARRAEVAFQQYLTGQATAATQPQLQTPQPAKPQTPEEVWRRDPELRREFNSNLNAYLAYCKAVREGRCKTYGGA